MTRAARASRRLGGLRGAAAAAGAAVLLCGCGQRGPLFLPNEPPAAEPVAVPAGQEPARDDADDDAE